MMKFHALEAEVQCPFCSLPKLAYERPGLHGDVYECSECHRRTLHRRQKGKPACGLVPVLNFAQLGPWQPCGP